MASKIGGIKALANNGQENNGGEDEGGNDDDVVMLAEAIVHGKETSPSASVVDNQFFYEDEVFKIDKRGNIKFGLILGNFDSMITSTDSADDSELLAKGQIRVAWHPEGKEEVLSENQVGLADRTLMPGDVVRRLVSGKNTQHGYCQEITVFADVNIVGTSYVIKSVPAERLRPMFRMPIDNAVCLDSWVGSTRSVKEKLVLRTSCGSIIELKTDSDLFPLRDIENRTREGFYQSITFYPGQVLIGPVCALENALWLYTSPEMRNRKSKTVDRKFIVQSVELEEVQVQWQFRSCFHVFPEHGAGECSFGEPPTEIKGEDLKKIKRLNLFESCMLQINDKNFLTFLETDSAIRKTEWKKELGSKYQIQRGRSQESRPKRSPKKTLDSRIVVSPLKLKRNKEEDEKPSEADFKIKVIMSTNSNKISDGFIKSRNTNTYSLKVHVSPPLQQRHMDLVKKQQNSHKQQLLTVSSEVVNSDDNEWQTDRNENESDSETESINTLSSCSSTTPKSSPKRSPLLSKKLSKKMHSKKSQKRGDSEQKLPEIGQEIVTESLVVYSFVSVVWQDGTIEKGIPSTELYPIHHLDNHEFFPGDFVLKNSDGNDALNHTYGVIQTVDHLGRIAKVKWFQTYTCAEEKQPQCLGETELSVYDLKDHPEFQYRPGTIVIRLTNQSADEQDSAGQVIDNSSEGKVNVWWVSGNVSSCWPQDLFEVGQYDAGNSFWSTEESDDSWETESEESKLGDLDETSNKVFLKASLERVKESIARLEMLFKLHPNIQSPHVMHQLMVIYKKCRYFDRLMNTAYFHEDNFAGLVERVRRVSCSSSEIKMLNSSSVNDYTALPNPVKEDGDGPVNRGHSTPIKTGSLTSTASGSSMTPSPIVQKSKIDMDRMSRAMAKFHYSLEDLSELRNHFMNNAQTCADGTTTIQNPRLDKKTDSGNYSEEIDDESGASATTQNPDSASLEIVCTKFCQLLKVQLTKAFHEINERYLQHRNSVVIEEIDEERDEEDEDRKDLAVVGIVKLEGEESLEDMAELINAIKVEPKNGETSPEIAANGLMLVVPKQETVEPLSPNFTVEDTIPITHKYNLTLFNPRNTQKFYRAVRREHELLRTGLPGGVSVKAYEHRMDLFSVLIQGPKNTPYEDGIFLFDIQLGDAFPTEPPQCHYISYCSDRLNPNLYEDGKVCVSLLGTWTGKGSEKWGANSSLLQLIVSIQGLILVAEPYYNEAGYEKQKGSQQGNENSRMYNEMAVIKLIQSMIKLMESPPEMFRQEIMSHFRKNGKAMYDRLQRWMEMSQEHNASKKLAFEYPDFPLIPASRGFCLTLVGLLDRFWHIIEAI